MYKNNRIAVVVPCYNEEVLVAKVISTMPSLVDKIIVVDDCSTDNTVSSVKSVIERGFDNVVLIQHSHNQGVGGAIASGYKLARDEGFDVAVVMAGDAQMDPNELESIVNPVVEEGYDYAKGNRLYTGDAWNVIPRVRYVGNSLLSLLTKVASGYWHVADSQSGYTAIGKKALETIDWDKMYKRYGQPNDLLVRLNIYNFRVKDVAIKPIYGIGEKSGIRPIRMIPKLSLLVIRLFFFRMFHKYFIRDFHPLIFFYAFGLTIFPIGFILGTYLFVTRLLSNPVAETSALFSVFMVIMGAQFVFFAMWMDMEYNKDLK